MSLERLRTAVDARRDGSPVVCITHGSCRDGKAAGVVASVLLGADLVLTHSHRNADWVAEAEVKLERAFADADADAETVRRFKLSDAQLIFTDVCPPPGVFPEDRILLIADHHRSNAEILIDAAAHGVPVVVDSTVFVHEPGADSTVFVHREAGVECGCTLALLVSGAALNDGTRLLFAVYRSGDTYQFRPEYDGTYVPKSWTAEGVHERLREPDGSRALIRDVLLGERALSVAEIEEAARAAAAEEEEMFAACRCNDVYRYEADGASISVINVAGAECPLMGKWIAAHPLDTDFVLFCMRDVESGAVGFSIRRGHPSTTSCLRVIADFEDRLGDALRNGGGHPAACGCGFAPGTSLTDILGELRGHSPGTASPDLSGSRTARALAARIISASLRVAACVEGFEEAEAETCRVACLRVWCSRGIWETVRAVASADFGERFERIVYVPDE